MSRPLTFHTVHWATVITPEGRSTAFASREDARAFAARIRATLAFDRRQGHPHGYVRIAKETVQAS